MQYEKSILRPENQDLKGKFASAHLHFVLTGFTHDTGFRVFAFEKMGADRAWTKCTVKADLGLIRKYGIHIQDLPLLCRGMLDSPLEEDDLTDRTLTFTEDAMQMWATQRAAAQDAAKKRKVPHHRPTPENTGAAWRGQQI